MPITPTAVNSSHTDANQKASLVLVAGTLGTTDTGGTALTMPASGNPLTGAAYVEILAGGGGGGGTSVISGGTLQIAGTITGGTIENINGGTITVSNPVVAVTVGTIPQISVGTLPSVTLANPGTFVNIVTGTQQTLGTVGTVNGVAVVAALTNGSVNILTGTLQSSGNGTVVGGTITNLATGTLNALASGTITGGTIQNIAGGTVISPMPSGTLNVGTVSVTTGTFGGAAANAAAASGNPVPYGGTDSGGTIRTIFVDATGVQRSSGTIVMSVGTVTGGTLQNLVSGTLNALAAGTITGGTLQNLASGTINSGTFVNNGGSVQVYQGTIQQNMVPVVVGTSYGTVGTTGAAVWGTLIAASGAGTKQYVSGVDVIVVSGTMEVAVTNIGIGGSTGAGVLARGNFPPGGGISKNFIPTQASGTNGTLAFWLGGAGTVDITIQYWNGV